MDAWPVTATPRRLAESVRSRVRGADLLAPVLAHVLEAIVPRGASSVWLAGTADAALATTLGAGLRIEGFPALLCWSEPFADFARYIPISPGLL